jgi:lysozyme
LVVNPIVVDLSHFIENVDFSALQGAGVVGVIHKATQGVGYVDPEYARRRGLAKSAGLLWGAYHFCTGEDPQKQYDNFSRAAQPGAGTLVAVNFEPNTVPGGSSMTLDQLRDFVAMVEGDLGRKPVIYGGHYLRQELDGQADSSLSQHRLWWAQYPANVSQLAIPPAWDHYWLWQYTDGKSGPSPQQMAGVGPCDINDFDGSADDLRVQWAS